MQRSFRDHFQLSVRDYLKAVRLDAALRDLAAADRQTDSVTSIAFRNGFTHLGRFSVEFNQRFGETPRTTLAARPRPKSYYRLESATLEARANEQQQSALSAAVTA